MKIKLTFLIFLLLIFPKGILSKNPIKSSDKMKPDWIVKELPRAKSSNYYFLRTEGLKPTLEEARAECLNQVAFRLSQKSGFAATGEIKKHVKTKRDKGGLGEDIDSEYVLTYSIKTDTVNIVLKKVDEYWEAFVGANSTIVYQCYTLYAIAENPDYPVFDEISFTYKYGGDALWRSALVPGYGQIYKGQTAKGISIMGGEALLIGGVVFCESQRASYQRKSKETHNIDKVRNYLDNADNYATYRNICIGAAAALYVYNIIDAVVSDGRKKTVVKPGHVYISPSATRDFKGISLTMNF